MKKVVHLLPLLLAVIVIMARVPVYGQTKIMLDENGDTLYCFLTEDIIKVQKKIEQGSQCMEELELDSVALERCLNRIELKDSTIHDLDLIIAHKDSINANERLKTQKALELYDQSKAVIRKQKRLKLVFMFSTLAAVIWAAVK